MKIREVEIFRVGSGSGWSPVIVRVNTDEGISGVGEVGLAYGVGASGGVGMVRDLAERIVLGTDPFRIEHVWDRMFRHTFWGTGGGPIVYGAMSAIDEALWDIKGKALGVPVHELLGGRCRDGLRVYANGWYHGIADPAEYGTFCQRLQEDGYTATKFDPFAVRPDGVEEPPEGRLDRERMEAACERVAAAREAAGPDFDILIEAHGNLDTVSAIRAGRRLEEFEPLFYEEPVHAMNVECMKEVARNVDIPLAAGERLYTRYGFRPYVESQCIQVLQPDMGLAGGITEVKKIAAHAATYNLHVQPHNCGGPVATAAAVQLDAAIPNFLIQEVFPFRGEDTLAIVTEPLEERVTDGQLPVPLDPGLGVELNDEYLSKHRCETVS
ncbi:MAG: mandelate racemase/muconate lactonizing enzyme family protein [Candidatus Brocadiaceae bacterium]|jgi:galactonate dehydratase